MYAQIYEYCLLSLFLSCEYGFRTDPFVLGDQLGGSFLGDVNSLSVVISSL